MGAQLKDISDSSPLASNFLRTSLESMDDEEPGKPKIENRKSKMLSSLKKSFPESFSDIQAVPVNKSFQSIKNIAFTESDNERGFS